MFSLYTMLGKEINHTSELISGEKYVAVGHGKRFVYFVSDLDFVQPRTNLSYFFLVPIFIQI
jgi:hypothetical protein